MRLMVVTTCLLLGLGCVREARYAFDPTSGQCVDDLGGVGLNQNSLGPCSDLRGLVLEDLDMSGLDLKGSDFSGSQLNRVNFYQSDLQAARFFQSVLVDVNFVGANLAGTVPETLKEEIQGH